MFVMFVLSKYYWHFRDKIHYKELGLKCSVNIENVLKISHGTNKT